MYRLACVVLRLHVCGNPVTIQSLRTERAPTARGGSSTRSGVHQLHDPQCALPQGAIIEACVIFNFDTQRVGSGRSGIAETSRCLHTREPYSRHSVLVRTRPRWTSQLGATHKPDSSLAATWNHIAACALIIETGRPEFAYITLGRLMKLQVGMTARVL